MANDIRQKERNSKIFELAIITRFHRLGTFDMSLKANRSWVERQTRHSFDSFWCSRNWRRTERTLLMVIDLPSEPLKLDRFQCCRIRDLINHIRDENANWIIESLFDMTDDRKKHIGIMMKTMKSNEKTNGSAFCSFPLGESSFRLIEKVKWAIRKALNVIDDEEHSSNTSAFWHWSSFFSSTCNLRTSIIMMNNRTSGFCLIPVNRMNIHADITRLSCTHLKCKLEDVSISAEKISNDFYSQ